MMVRRLYEEREPSYLEISAAIRLGRKYKIAELYSQSVEFLHSYFSNTLREYGETTVLLPPGWKELGAIGVINLARLTGELSLLPSAFVICISAKSTGSDGIVHGSGQEDGSEEHLSPDDLAICFNGKSSVRIATISAVFKTFKPIASPACVRRGSCRAALGQVLLNLGEKLDLLLDGDPFASCQKFWGAQGSPDLCGPCMDMARERNLRERRDVWISASRVVGHRCTRMGPVTCSASLLRSAFLLARSVCPAFQMSPFWAYSSYQISPDIRTWVVG